MDDLISAIATAVGAGGIAVVRMSGRGALSVARKMFSRKGEFQPNYMYAGEIDAGTFRDYGMCVYFRAPKSFTGEDVVEFHCHGGTEIARGILKRTLELGARLAERGEFTKRAYLNGKLSLSAAEGVGEMIAASSEAQVRAGYLLYNEKLTSLGTALQRKLTHCLAEVDADLDYPEEDLNASSRAEIAATLREVGQELAALLSQYAAGRKIRSGVSVALVGAPNAGKSSLLNALLGYERAIVSDVAGTTRDVVEGSLEIGGVRFNLYDTAGIRDSDDAIESIGIRRAKSLLEGADLVLFILDASEKMSAEDREIYDSLADKKKLVVYNKTDLGEESAEAPPADIRVSAKTGENIGALREKMFRMSMQGYRADAQFIIEERHYGALRRAERAIGEACAACGSVPLDLLGMHLKEAWEALGEISGETANERIIDEIFAKFCVGK